MNYSAFISYRREGGADTARLIRTALAAKGYAAFLDVDDLGASHFDERLLVEIEKSPNFIVILSPESLERCQNKTDWLRREIAHAIATQKNIVPILKEGFVFPSQTELPKDIALLPKYNCVVYSHIYFDSTINKLIQFFEEAKPRKSFLKRTAMVLLLICVIILLRALPHDYIQHRDTENLPPEAPVLPTDANDNKLDNESKKQEQSPKKQTATTDPADKIIIDPNEPETYIMRGNAYRNQDELEKALIDFSSAIKLAPDNAYGFYGRGIVHQRQEKFDDAISDFTAALSLRPDLAQAYERRGIVYHLKEQFSMAIDDLTKANQLKSGDATISNHLAWILSTCPQNHCRDGKRALILAQKAVSGSPKPAYLDTLAAAYAETGDFEAAVATQAKALSLAVDEDEATKGYVERLRYYKEKKPWREKHVVLE